MNLIKLLLCAKMFFHAGIVFVVGYLSGVNAQSTTTLMPTFCTKYACYIRPDIVQRNWTDALQICKEYGSTLPNVSDSVRQRSFETACINLTSSNERYTGIWIGAKAYYSDIIGWTWLNGNKYEGAVLQSQGGYQNGYSYVANSASSGISAYASHPRNVWSYICYYPISEDFCVNSTGKTAFYIESRCYVKYDAKMSWFSARNNCLTNNGDLASFTQLSLLDGKIGSNGCWIGLRNSKWQWENAVTGDSSDVTFTLWCSDQPDDTVPTCISTDEFPCWRDYDCSQMLPFICQVNSTTWTTPSTSLTTPDTGTFSLTSTHSEEHLRNDTPSVNLGLPVGLGVGLGVPVVILIVVVIIVIILRRKRQTSSAGGNSQSTNKFVSKNGLSSPEPETSEMSEIGNGRSASDNSSAQYAVITGAMGLDQDTKLPSNQGIVYAPLSFNQANS